MELYHWFGREKWGEGLKSRQVIRVIYVIQRFNQSPLFLSLSSPLSVSI